MLTKATSNSRSRVFDTVVFGYLILILVMLFLQQNDEQLLDMHKNGIIVLASLLFSFVVTLFLNRLGVVTLGLAIFESDHDKVRREPCAWFKTFWGVELLFLVTVTFAIGLNLTKFSFYELFDGDGFQGAKRIMAALLTPEFSVWPKGILAIIETFFMAFIATMIAIPAAFLLAFFCAKNVMIETPLARATYFILRTFLNVTRSIEPLIWAIIFSVWVGIGPFAGMLALMLHSVASLTKQYSEIIESVNQGPIEGIRATGANQIQTVWFGIVPQIVLPYISFTIYRWDINIRMATVIGLVGGGGIGTLLIQYQGQAMWHEVGALALLIILVVWALDTASAYIREALK